MPLLVCLLTYSKLLLAFKVVDVRLVFPPGLHRRREVDKALLHWIQLWHRARKILIESDENCLFKRKEIMCDWK